MRLLKQAAMFAALMFGLAIGATAMTTPTFAQEIVQAVDATAPTLLQQTLVIALPAIFGLLTLVSLLIYAEIKRRFGIEIEAKHREAFQSALENGIKWGMQQAGWLPKDGVKPTDLLNAATGYVVSSVPDALKHFKIDPSTSIGKAKLERLLIPHLPEPKPGDKLIGRLP